MAKKNKAIELPDDAEVKVHYSSGRTINLGNYESTRVDIGLSIVAEGVGLDNAYAFAKRFVDERIEMEVEDRGA